MSNNELSQLEMLSAIDDLRDGVSAWVAQPTHWEPMRRCQSLLTRVLDRVETLRIRLEAPLVVATFGGTGTGKSSLVNALIGSELSPAGRQRPTTRKPVVITGPETDVEAIGLPLDELELVQAESELLREIVLIDCPDPDTNEAETRGSNLERLHALLPYCDVLLYVSTQQKYRSARVTEELQAAAAGCRLIFVQTHADLDSDVRDDWRNVLAEGYDVPEMYFVDSVKALKEQQEGHRPTGEMGQLIDLLTKQLGASERVRVRRANVVDLLQRALARCGEILETERPGVEKLRDALLEQQTMLSQRMAAGLKDELLSSRSLWERRLLGDVTETWGLSPFSSMLRTYNGLGSILASMTLMRARSTAQLAIVGAIQGARWWEGKRREQEASETLGRLSGFGLDDALLREAELVIEGHVRSAGMGRDLLRDNSLDELRRQAAEVEHQFLGDAGNRIDELIRELSQRNSRLWIRAWYELLFVSYLLFVLYRVGKNFFYESFVLDEALLSTDFYIAAALFFVLWTGLLVMLFTRRLRRGLDRKIGELVQQLVEIRLSRGLFPQLETASRDAVNHAAELKSLAQRTNRLRDEIASSTSLGGRRSEPRPSTVKK